MEEEEHMAVRSFSPASAHPWPGALLRGEEEREHEGSAAHGDDRRRGGHVRHQASLLEKNKVHKNWIFSKICPYCGRFPGRGLLAVESSGSRIFQAKYSTLVFCDDSTTLFTLNFCQLCNHDDWIVPNKDCKLIWVQFIQENDKKFFLQNSSLNKKTKCCWKYIWDIDNNNSWYNILKCRHSTPILYTGDINNQEEVLFPSTTAFNFCFHRQWLSKTLCIFFSWF